MNGGAGENVFTFKNASVFAGKAIGGDNKDTFTIDDAGYKANTTDGGAGDDIFNLNKAITETVELTGGAGDDTFNINEAQANAKVTIAGGDGTNDTVVLKAGVSQNLQTGLAGITGIENIVVNAGDTLTVGTAVGDGYNITINGAGDTVAMGAGKTDTVTFGTDVSTATITGFEAADKLNVNTYLNDAAVSVQTGTAIAGTTLAEGKNVFIFSTGVTSAAAKTAIEALNFDGHGVFIVNSDTDKTYSVFENDEGTVTLLGTVASAAELGESNIDTGA